MTIEEQWERTKKSIMRYLKEGWSINYAKRSAGLNAGSPMYRMYQTDMEFKEQVKPYIQFKTPSFYARFLHDANKS